MLNIADCSFTPLITEFDCIGWVPTIRGSISLHFFDNSDSILGDVDKYAVEFQTYNGLSSSRYLVASSLFTFDDNKADNYCRTFRFIFRGTINDDARQNEFICKKLNNNAESEKLFNENKLLIGKLSIVANLSNKIPEKESQFLESMKKLVKAKKEYEIEYCIKAATCEKLEDMRKNLKNDWEKIETEIIAIEDDSASNPIYTFDMVLSRDGILFLKDDTCDKFRKDYYEKDMASDFTQNIPVHRLFKTAMNFVKFLLHKNYHHNEEHDTFLPVTNLYPVKTNWETEKIIRHQIESFMRPITRVKRYDSYNSCNPIGIALYAESFLYIFEKNGFISEKDANFLHKFIDIQKDEIKILCEDNNTISGFFLTQKNILATITAGLTFLLATIAIIDFLFKENAVNKCNLHPDIEIVSHIIIILVTFGVGVLIKNWAVRRALSKRKFYKKKKKRNLLNKDSDITNGKLSFLYALRLFLIEVKLSIKKIIGIYAVEISNLICIALIFALVVFSAYKLLYCFVFM